MEKPNTQEEDDDDGENSAVQPNKSAKAKKKEVAYNPFDDFESGANDETTQGGNGEYNPFADFMDGVGSLGINVSYNPVDCTRSNDRPCRKK